MPRTKKKAVPARTERCPTCKKDIDFRGIKSHMLTHRPKGVPAQVQDTLQRINTDFDHYRRGYRDGYADGLGKRD